MQGVFIKIAFSYSFIFFPIVQFAFFSIISITIFTPFLSESSYLVMLEQGTALKRIFTPIVLAILWLVRLHWKISQNKEKIKDKKLITAFDSKIGYIYLK